MSRDADAKADPKLTRLYDKRTVDRSIKKGLLTRKDFDKHLKALEDVADKGVYGTAEPRIEDEPDDLDEIDEGEDEADGAPDHQPG
jgi:hypothetical protein